MSAAVCAFDSVDGCTNTVIQTIQAGIPIARCDIVVRQDHRRASTSTRRPNYRVAPTLFFEFHGTKASVVEQAETVQAIARENGGMDFQLGDEARGAHPALGGAPRRLLRLPADPARLARGVDRRVRADLAPRRVRARDHGGREELHRAGAAARPRRRRQLPPHVPGRPEASPRRPSSPRRSTSAWSSARCAMEGTCTGEHGIGLGKRARCAGARRGRDRRDARHQAALRPGEPDEPRKGRFALSA